MKKLVLCFSVFLLFGGCANASGQKYQMHEKPSNDDIIDIPDGYMMPGGYTEIRTPDDEELEIFNTAMGENAKEYSVIAVSTQIVAGVNYKFYTEKPSDNWNTDYIYITIYKPLGDAAPSVTSIESDTTKDM